MIVLANHTTIPARRISTLLAAYNHIAFKINDAEFDLYESRIRALGVDIRPSRPKVEEEGRSLYFCDYDNHLFELHTGTLSKRVERYNQ